MYNPFDLGAIRDELMADLNPLIGYIVDQVRDQGGSLNKTALVKLVYLVDLEHYRSYGKRATEINWMFHHYGPYERELDRAISSNPYVDMDGDRRTGYRFSTSGSESQNAHRNFSAQYERATQLTVDKVLRQWGLEPLNVILDYVYFETEPMQNVERGDYLDFSSVVRIDRTLNRSIEIELPEGHSEELRARWEQQKEERRKQPPAQPVYVPYNEVTEEGFRVRAERERMPWLENVPNGTRVNGPSRGTST